MSATKAFQEHCRAEGLTPAADASRAEGLRKDIHGAIKRDFGKWAADNKALIVSTATKKVL